ncbi:hypothetical protein AAZX31_08G041300 [Glycine max]|uniref:VQ domain-containing protein n=2 Tax=Glycine subgen. Soja TaxID=1462606 RepID=K7L4X4_SOYBN|nr:VQ motif-containing protein 20 [Glycine max]XP_028247375.1 VQ motif-containing protein 20-like [Glycine soja]KAG4999246.1 hypothetical protein JHK87_020318 [Glycine soja]KAG5024521.1 hypothetical protein JHK86_020435 [Glycine max]KAG5135691.1 hypothetical protein JHK82_020422 [Glycine max]KAH1049576.1 hypothetical protein GYH30_020198 [Glycine max]KAH1236001.1 VQ motif-containing protein 20 [Glycine max]|eukprot:XP_014633879.1 VQ motif-containing protein 20 [Glycine max]
MGKGQGGLKMNRESHLIRKSSSSSLSKAQQQRPPVIIYTHPPKVIHTHARNFMELVQKLTGLYRTDPEDNGGGEEVLKPPTPPRKEEPKANEAASPEEVESSCYNCVDYAKNYAVFESDFLCSNNKPLLTFADPSFFFSG